MVTDDRVFLPVGDGEKTGFKCAGAVIKKMTRSTTPRAPKKFVAPRSTTPRAPKKFVAPRSTTPRFKGRPIFVDPIMTHSEKVRPRNDLSSPRIYEKLLRERASRNPKPLPSKELCTCTCKCRKCR